MNSALKSVLDYFNFFDYAPSFEQVLKFYPQKIKATDLKKNILNAVSAKEIVWQKSLLAYQDSTITKTIGRQKEALKKIQKNLWFLKFIGFLPSIRFIGLSGSVAVGNANKDDDLDIFIITKESRLFTARFYTYLFSALFGLRRSRLAKKTKDKLCFNLFFDECDLAIPKHKQTLYVGHEILQLLLIVNKNKTLEKFVQANNWLLDYFPNFIEIRENLPTYNTLRSNVGGGVGNLIEYFLRKLQLYFIRRHQTLEYITDKQLWFFPKDFEVELTKKSLQKKKTYVKL